MKRKNLNAVLFNLALLLVVPASMCMMSCSEEVTAASEDAAEAEDEIILNVTFDGEPMDGIATRAITAPVNDIYLYAYQGTTRKAYNVRYTIVNGVWKPYSLKVTWPAKDALFSLYGLTDSYKEIALDSMKYRYIHYDVDPITEHDVWYGSTVNTNKTKSGGNVNMNFTRLVSRVHFACKNSFEDGQVHINKIEILNLVRKGKFTYNEKTAGAGTWSLLDAWGTYTRTFTTKVVNPKVSKQLVTDNDNTFILIPQNTSKSKWMTTADSPVPLTGENGADALHQVYLAVYCRIFKETTAGSGEYDQCIWGTGGEDDYKPIYIPLAKTWAKSNSATTIIFDIAKGYKEDGTEWEQEAGDQITFSESMLLEPEEDDSGNVDSWEENSEDAFSVTLSAQSNKTSKY